MQLTYRGQKSATLDELKPFIEALACKIEQFQKATSIVGIRIVKGKKCKTCGIHYSKSFANEHVHYKEFTKESNKFMSNKAKKKPKDKHTPKK